MHAQGVLVVEDGADVEVGDDAGDGFRLLVIRVAFGVLVEAEFGQGLAVEIGLHVVGYVVVALDFEAV